MTKHKASGLAGGGRGWPPRRLGRTPATGSSAQEETACAGGSEWWRRTQRMTLSGRAVQGFWRDVGIHRCLSARPRRTGALRRLMANGGAATTRVRLAWGTRVRARDSTPPSPPLGEFGRRASSLPGARALCSAGEGVASLRDCARGAGRACNGVGEPADTEQRWIAEPSRDGDVLGAASGSRGSRDRDEA